MACPRRTRRYAPPLRRNQLTGFGYGLIFAPKLTNKTMRYFNAVLFLALAVLLSACGGNTYYLTTNDARGLTSGDEVYRQGIVVGEVENVRFEGSEVRIEISTAEPLYENQGFSISRGADGPQLELDRPGNAANPLADGASIRDNFADSDLLSGLDDLGDGLSRAMENAFGRDGEKLEYSLEKLANRFEQSAEGWGKALENWAKEHEGEIEEWAEQLENNSEDLEKAAEDWAKKHEREFKQLGRKLERWSQENEPEFKAFSEEIDAWAEDFDGDMNEFVRELERVSDRHKVGSDAWKQEMKQVLEELK